MPLCSSLCRLDEANQCVFEQREKIDRQNQQLSDYEAEINLLRRRVEILDNDRDKDKKLIATLQEALNRARIVRMANQGRDTGVMTFREPIREVVAGS